MTCAELKELAPLYAIGALEPADRRAVEQHLAEGIRHEGCEEAVREAVEAAALLGEALAPVAPPARIWMGIDRAVAIDAKPTRRIHGAPRRDFGRLLEGRALLGGLAALLLLAIGVRFFQRASEARMTAALNAHLVEQDEALRGCLGEMLAMKHQLQLQRMALDLLERPSTEVVSLAVQGGESYRANVILNQTDKKAVVVAGALREQKDRDYELWIIRGQEKIAAGLLHGDEDGRAIAEVDGRLLAAGVDAFAVTLEPIGGGTAPKGPVLLVGKVKKG
jgi:anti-sigma-K factor RskA